MKLPCAFDIIIIGGGPAGACAALRLLQMGHQVALIEQESFPREQIGESLSPGVRNIFKYLGAEHLLEKRDYIHELPTKVIWETKFIDEYQKEGGIIVKRSSLDEDLINLAVHRGLHLFQPAKYISSKYVKEKWQVNITYQNSLELLTSRFVLDARGRSGTNKGVRINTGLPNVALWTHLPSKTMPAETLVEAVRQGWIWGAPVSDNRFRVMAFTDAKNIKNKSLLKVLNEFCRDSNLFKPKSKDYIHSGIQTCLVQNYSHFNPWNNNYLALGECAFSLDPLSSSGVEKAMRFSLQAAIAVNTVILKENIALAKSYYEDRLIESVVNHTKWTSAYYFKAWPSFSYEFWRARSEFVIEQKKDQGEFYNKLRLAFRCTAKENVFNIQRPISVCEALITSWHTPVKISANVSYVRTTCVVGDELEVRTAIRHPNLQHEISFINGVDIISLLSIIGQSETLGEVINKWSYKITFYQAAHIAVTLLNSGIICFNDM